MRKNKINIGIIGGNFGASVHLPAFRLDPRCEVVGIVASTKKRSEELSQQFNIPKSFENWKDLIQSKEIDAVSLAVPPFLQHEIAMEVLKEGKPVFAEKPLGISVEQAKELHELAITSNLPNMVNFHHTALNTWIKAKEIIQSGDIGILQHIVIQYAGETPIPILENSWKAEKGPGGGALYDVLIHMFHHLEWFGGPITSLSARLFSTIQNDPSKDTFDVLIAEFASGAVASVTVSRTTILGACHKVEISGSEGTLILESLSEDTRNFRLLQGLRADPKLEVIMASSLTRNYKTPNVRIASVGKLVERFLDWVETGTFQEPNFADGLRAQHLAEVAALSDKEGQRLKIG